MTDFFGGISDTLRGLGDDASSFLGVDNGTLARSVAYGIKNSGLTTKNTPVPIDTGFYSGSAASANHRQNAAVRPAQADDFNQIEYQWLRRIQKFAQMDTNTKVTAGKPNVA